MSAFMMERLCCVSLYDGEVRCVSLYDGEVLLCQPL